MSRHLKSEVIYRLENSIGTFVKLPPVSCPRARGVRYFAPIALIEAVWGAMNTQKEGRHYRKHIVLRHYPRAKGLLQLYTYHFPQTWSAVCEANRDLIKIAQRRAHDLEHDYSCEGLEWKIRFFRYYFTVIKGGAQPEPGMKRYARFYQYTYVYIYRSLHRAQQQADEVTFDPIQTTSNFQTLQPSNDFKPSNPLMRCFKPSFTTKNWLSLRKIIT